MIATPIGPIGVAAGVAADTGWSGIRNVSCCSVIMFGFCRNCGLLPLYAWWRLSPTGK